ncbi:hypothetical protein MUU47_21325 [Scandinavium sp. H11S7]|uniref:Uncharacterized protein n=1 Tax=Scandinavium hiltneri TaxID=2926519 RepID=A0ABT2E9D8_9ENTR|nr:hypothetical protein [Scandinavium hiltneri]MCS2163617.1 hypothetical protein [Scandinavium hiltneri]
MARYRASQRESHRHCGELTFHEKFPVNLNKKENENYTHYSHCFKHKYAGFLKAKERPQKGACETDDKPKTFEIRTDRTR